MPFSNSYGEQGSVIIHQTLFNLFPPSSFDSSLVEPLTPTEFIQRVLVPETAAHLIAQDLGVDMDYAIMTLHESARYGVAMFPDTGGSDGKRVIDEEMGVADQIVMERARARRKELEEEERVEEEMVKEEAQKKARTRRERFAGRALNGQKAREPPAVESDDLTEQSEMSTRTRLAKRRDKMRLKDPPAEDDSEASEVMSVDSSSSRRCLRSSGKPSKRIVQERRFLTSDNSESVEPVDVSKHAKGKNAKPGNPANIIYPVEDEQTPRPSRRTESAAINVSAMPKEPNHNSSVAHPLQIARNRKARCVIRNNKVCHLVQSLL